MPKKVLKWLIFLAVGLFAASAYLFFFGEASFSERGVKLEISGPTQAAVGDEVVYKVMYENTTSVPLNDVKLTFSYPPGAVIFDEGRPRPSRSDDPASFNQTTEFAAIQPGEKKEEEFHMFLVGDRGNIKTAKVKLEFNAGDLRSRFEKTAEAATTITEVPVSLTMSAPPNAVSGDTISYVLDYRNQSNDTISDLRAVFAYPEGFTPKTFSPSPAQGLTWNLKPLKKADGGRITITGTINGREGESKQITMTLQRGIDGTFVDYERASALTVISSPLLNVSLKVNESADYVAHPGDTLQYAVDYRNASNVSLGGLKLSVRLEGDMYEYGSLDPKGGLFDAGTRTITWDAAALPNLSLLRPNQTGRTLFTLNLKPALTGSGARSLFVRAVAQLSTDQVPSGIDSEEIKVQNELVTKITTQPTFDQKLYYNDAAFGSTGPMPPKVGQETVFTVRWRIANPGNPLANAKITATLPTGVTWKNVIGVGAGLNQPTYNKNSSQITWDLGSIPQGVGISSDKYELAFQVSVKPAANQIGNEILLLRSISLSGTDSFTEQSIIVNAGDLTTSNTVDQPGNGIVQ